MKLCPGCNERIVLPSNHANHLSRDMLIGARGSTPHQCRNCSFETDLTDLTKLVRIATGAGVTGSSLDPTTIIISSDYDGHIRELIHGQILPFNGFFFHTCSQSVEYRGLGSRITDEVGEPTDDELIDLFQRVRHCIMFYFQNNQDRSFDSL